ncbi:HNH endonuclease family protein [Mycobacterium sp. Z3061]|uniref:HNH endonuclease family protein n=1 Tax=Mycobacterium sp. Z3061 TaxID=3073562 RepID=UPI0037CABE53
MAGGHNACDTRNDILRRDLEEVEIKTGSNGCTVLVGVLHDLYSGATTAFQRGQDTSSEIHVDHIVAHIVALADAWQKGAQQWDPIQRRNFANDPINLQATTASINEQKSDGDAATWLPPNKSYRCTYVSRIIDVKATYALWVTQAEHDAIAGILITCGRVVLGELGSRGARRGLRWCVVTCPSRSRNASAWNPRCDRERSSYDPH